MVSFEGRSNNNRIVFTGSAVLKDVTSNYHVVYDFNLLETILSFRTIFLTDNDVHRVVDILLHNNIREGRGKIACVRATKGINVFWEIIVG